MCSGVLQPIARYKGLVGWVRQSGRMVEISARQFGIGVCAVALLLQVAPVAAQSSSESFPSKPVHIVVPFGPGSGTDTATRMLAQHLEAGLKRSVVVENKPGASGAVAAQAIARAAPDGYSLLMGTNSTHGANPGLIAKLGYDPIKDFVPVGMVGVFASFLVVNPALPIRTPAELIAYGKANPKALTFAAGNTSSLIMGEMFARDAGIEMLRVPYQSNPAGITDVIGGRVSVMFPDVASSLAHVKAGTLRALASVSLGDRIPQAPDLPTVSETVLPNFRFVGWIGLFAPAGTPESVVNVLSAELRKSLAKPEMVQRFQQMGAEAKWMAPTDFRAYVASEVVRLPRILADIGVQPQ